MKFVKQQIQQKWQVIGATVSGYISQLNFTQYPGKHGTIISIETRPNPRSTWPKTRWLSTFGINLVKMKWLRSAATLPMESLQRKIVRACIGQAVNFSEMHSHLVFLNQNLLCERERRREKKKWKILSNGCYKVDLENIVEINQTIEMWYERITCSIAPQHLKRSILHKWMWIIAFNPSASKAALSKEGPKKSVEM